MEQTEKEITNSIRRLLKTLNIFVWKAWQGPMSQPKGVADLLGLLPPTGRFLAIEVKRPGGRLSPDQIAFLERIRRNGGVAIVAYGLQDVIDGLGVKNLFLGESKFI